MSRQIVTRFAPSPTGYLHIGGARTALFNWLYARGRIADGNGQFLLRIEDTDRSRHNEGAVAAILDGLSWLGLDWDGEPISQFERAPRHAEVANQLLEQGRAYRCWLAGDDLNAAREAAKAAGTRFESPWRDATSGFPDGPYSIRLKAPRTGETLVRDLIQGDVRFPADAMDDMVMLRSDGTPTYMLAVVVDDHDMDISHVIRGDDHLVNAGRQQQLYQALDWEIPAFAHVPLIHGPDGAKLSKRHGALGVEAYRDLGYTPEGLANYLLRLGWSHGDDEIIPVDKAKEWFDVTGINKAPSRLDIDKLNHVNAHYLHQMGDAAMITAAEPFLAGVAVTDALTQRLQRAAPFLKERMQTFADIAEVAKFVTIERPLDVSGKAGKPLKRDGISETLQEISERLDAIGAWQEDRLEQALKDYAEEKGVGFGQVGPPLRAALTAGHPSPSLGQVLYALGKEESLARINDQIAG